MIGKPTDREPDFKRLYLYEKNRQHKRERETIRARENSCQDFCLSLSAFHLSSFDLLNRLSYDTRLYET